MVKLFLYISIAIFAFAKTQFLVPSEQSRHDEVFQYDKYYEFVISNQQLEWDQAEGICKYEYAGVLATLETEEMKKFAVEAMSESSMNLDSLWIGLRRKEDSFEWLHLNITVSLAQLAECGNNSISSYECGSNCLDDMDCGAIVRANHTHSCFVNFKCEANRGFICKRRAKSDSSTHPGWIQVRQRLFKIFAKQLSYDYGNLACISLNARLAVVETYEDAQRLGRYLLIGRPSLERVWIGGRWQDDFDRYEFEAEPMVFVSNTSDPSRYPPWRKGNIDKPYGCLLLDRHVNNITYFVESDCGRFHSYMCYKMVDEDLPVDICDVGDYDWRVYHNKLNWFDAGKECNVSAKTGRLPVLKEKDLKYFVYIMETNKRYLLHAWLGGYFLKGVWTWTYTNHTIEPEKNAFPPWVVNKSYVEEIERSNKCLNIDRENALVPLFYGTFCYYAQSFVCQYDQGTICSPPIDMTTEIGLTSTSIAIETSTEIGLTSTSIPIKTSTEPQFISPETTSKKSTTGHSTKATQTTTKATPKTTTKTTPKMTRRSTRRPPNPWDSSEEEGETLYSTTTLWPGKKK